MSKRKSYTDRHVEPVRLAGLPKYKPGLPLAISDKHDIYQYLPSWWWFLEAEGIRSLLPENAGHLLDEFVSVLARPASGRCALFAINNLCSGITKLFNIVFNKILNIPNWLSTFTDFVVNNLLFVLFINNWCAFFSCL